MTLKDLAEKVVVYLAKYAGMKFTGQIIFTFNFRDGGIGTHGVEIRQKQNEPFSLKGR